MLWFVKVLGDDFSLRVDHANGVRVGNHMAAFHELSERFALEEWLLVLGRVLLLDTVVVGVVRSRRRKHGRLKFKI